MDNNEAKVLIETFKAYRDLLDPIQTGLKDFAVSYDSMKENIDKLSAAFGGEVKDNLESIYKTLSAQAAKASDLSSRIEQFASVSLKYTAEVTKLLSIFENIEKRLVNINSIEGRAEEQIGRLDAILEEKQKNYNVKELQKTLDVYNTNVQKVSDFINRDVAESLTESQKKLEAMNGGLNELVKIRKGDSAGLEKLLEEYAVSNSLLKKVTEAGDVKEEYIFEILDRWAIERKVKIKKD